MVSNKVCIIALKYLESYWESTQKDIVDSNLPVIYVDREGVGSMTKAFNSAIPELYKNFGDNQPEYLFFVTNNNFTTATVNRLIDSMDKTNFAAIHPSHNSDHPSHKNNKSDQVIETKYIEWTSPIVKTDLFLKYPLNENYYYWFFDLVWSYEIKALGHKIGVDHGAFVDHRYLVKDLSDPISKKRKELRDTRNVVEHQILNETYGNNWQSILL
jgi:hypothetical protein